MVTQRGGGRTEATRGRIRAAARRLFLQQGFAGASTDAIRDAAGVSKETLYRHYPSKEALFADVLRELTLENPHTPILDLLASPTAASPAEFRNELTAIAQAIVVTLMQPDYLALLRMIFAEAPRFPQLRTLFRATVPEQAMRGVAALLARAHAAGLVRTDDLDAATRLFLGPLLTHLVLDGLLATDEPPQPPDPERIARIVGLYLAAVA
jgi:TetR/AcrR family transcriptional repressor of mexJK operon